MILLIILVIVQTFVSTMAIKMEEKMMLVKRFKTVICITLCSIVAVILMLHFICYNIIADPSGLKLQSVTVDQQYIIVSGFNYGGMYNYRSYTTKYEDGVLYKIQWGF